MINQTEGAEMNRNNLTGSAYYRAMSEQAAANGEAMMASWYSEKAAEAQREGR